MGGAQRRPDLLAESGEGRNRTGDTTVFSRVLYQLSYLARAGRSVAAELERRSGGGEPVDQDVDELALHQHRVGAGLRRPPCGAPAPRRR